MFKNTAKRIIKKTSDLLIKNLGWKLLSLIIAAGLWFVVVNETNPTAITPTPYSVSLSIVNKEKLTESRYVLLNEAMLRATTVDISVRGSRSDLAELSKKRGELRAYIDLSPIDLSKTLLLREDLPTTVKIDWPKSLTASKYELVNVNPMTVNVVLDELVTISSGVTVDLLGEPATGYVFLQSVVEPASVDISGPQSVIETVASVRADINISESMESFNNNVPVRVIDGNGRDITSQLTLSTAGVYVSVPVQKYARIPIIEPPIFGTPAPGWRVTGVEWTPQIAEVVGEDADVDALEHIELGPISVEGADSSFTELYDLRNNLLSARSSCNIRNGTPHEVQVTIVLEKEEEAEITLRPKNVLPLSAPNNYELDFTEITLVVSGLKAVLAQFADDQISAIIDMTGLAAGTYELQSTILLPAGMTLISDEPLIEVTILDQAAAPEDKPATERRVKHTNKPGFDGGEDR